MYPPLGSLYQALYQYDPHSRRIVPRTHIAPHFASSPPAPTVSAQQTHSVSATTRVAQDLFEERSPLVQQGNANTAAAVRHFSDPDKDSFRFGDDDDNPQIADRNNDRDDAGSPLSFPSCGSNVEEVLFLCDPEPLHQQPLSLEKRSQFEKERIALEKAVQKTKNLFQSKETEERIKLESAIRHLKKKERVALEKAKECLKIGTEERIAIARAKQKNIERAEERVFGSEHKVACDRNALHQTWCERHTAAEQNHVREHCKALLEETERRLGDRLSGNPILKERWEAIVNEANIYLLDLPIARQRLNHLLSIARVWNQDTILAVNAQKTTPTHIQTTSLVDARNATPADTESTTLIDVTGEESKRKQHRIIEAIYNAELNRLNSSWGHLEPPIRFASQLPLEQQIALGITQNHAGAGAAAATS